MQEWEEKMLERKEAFEAGEATGKALGEERMGKLMEHLLESGRTEDIKKALADVEYKNKLYEEFGI